MTNTGLEKIKRASDVYNTEPDDLIDTDHPSEMQKELKELKEERLQLQKEIDKTTKKTGSINLDDPNTINKVNKAASKFADLHWVLDRFTY